MQTQYKMVRTNDRLIIKEKPKKSKKKIVISVISGILAVITVFSGAIIKKSDAKRQRSENAVASVYYVQTQKYDEIVKDIKKVMNQIGCTTPIEIFAIYNHMLWNGYFSENHEYKYDNKDLYDIAYNYGLDIFDGEGVCRHNSDLLARIFKEFGYNSFTVNAYISEKLNIDFQKGIERNRGEFQEGGFGNYFTSNYGNHQLVVVIDGSSVNFFDPTNLAVFKLSENDQLTLINGVGQITLKPMSEYILNGIDIDEIRDIFKIRIGSDIKSLSEEEVNIAFDNSLEKYEENEVILEKFYDDQKENYSEINSSFKGE